MLHVKKTYDDTNKTWNKSVFIYILDATLMPSVHPN